ncbi:hypothetical protein P7K49_020363, partial [Saguinus oedipus]
RGRPHPSPRTGGPDAAQSQPHLALLTAHARRPRLRALLSQLPGRHQRRGSRLRAGLGGRSAAAARWSRRQVSRATSPLPGLWRHLLA